MAWNPDVGASNWNDGAASGGDEFPTAGDTTLHDVDDNLNDGGANDFKCRRCGELGHKARECPTAHEESRNDGKCFNCGEEGHNRAGCTKPRVFKGECRICKQAGHPASECPEKPADKCFNCKEEGHTAVECKNKRVFDYTEVDDLTAQDAWNKLLEADEARELEDVRSALKAYSRAVPDVTYAELEKAFRQTDLNTHLIATEKELPLTHTFVNLQGEIDKKYQVGFHLSDKPRRGNAIAGWPKDADDNSERLKDAGLPMDRGIPKCTRCNELGHRTRACAQEALDSNERVVVKCVNCDEVGHRARDCPTPRIDKFACRNCKKSGHQSSECPEPRSAEGVECKRCNKMGHFAKDCPTKGGNKCNNCGEEGHMAKECEKPRNPQNVTCRNCEEVGHFSRDCPKPHDYSKVKCQNCGEMGHTKVRCNNPAIPDDVGEENGGTGNTGSYGGSGANESKADETLGSSRAAGGGDEWESSTNQFEASTPPTTVGGW